MRGIERFPQIAVALLTAVLAFSPGCTEKKDTAIPRGRGVFYQPEEGKAVAMLSGSAVEMVARAIPIAGTARPSFLVSFPVVRAADVRIAVKLTDNTPGAFQSVDCTVTPVEGGAGVYKVNPNADLPAGLSAIVISPKEELTNDLNNIYPFKLEAPPQ